MECSRSPCGTAQRRGSWAWALVPRCECSRVDCTWGRPSHGNEGQTVNRTELRELADLYFARFSDRLEERIALSEAYFVTNFWTLDRRDLRRRTIALFEGLRRMRDQMKW